MKYLQIITMRIRGKYLIQILQKKIIPKIILIIMKMNLRRAIEKIVK